MICDEAFRPDTEVLMLLLAGPRLLRLEGKLVRVVVLADEAFEFGISLAPSNRRNEAILSGVPRGKSVTAR